MGKSIISIRKALSRKQVVKVITGLANLDVNDVISKVKAAEVAGATYVDIAANPELVCLVKSITSIPVCVSSINPRDLYECVLVGADMVEIGNFDVFYSKNIIFSYNQIRKISRETRCLLNNTHICVTIPHNLLLEQQIDLAIYLEQIGIDCIQTEGLKAKQKVLHVNTSAMFQSINRSSLSLSSCYAISNYVNIPVIAASGINALSAPVAISYGASGVAIGSVLNNFKNIHEISSYIKEVIASIYYDNNCLSNQISSVTSSLLKMNDYNKLYCH